MNSPYITLDRVYAALGILLGDVERAIEERDYCRARGLLGVAGTLVELAEVADGYGFFDNEEEEE